MCVCVRLLALILYVLYKESCKLVSIIFYSITRTIFTENFSHWKWILFTTWRIAPRMKKKYSRFVFLKSYRIYREHPRRYCARLEMPSFRGVTRGCKSVSAPSLRRNRHHNPPSSRNVINAVVLHMHCAARNKRDVNRRRHQRQAGSLIPSSTIKERISHVRPKGHFHYVALWSDFLIKL